MNLDSSELNLDGLVGPTHHYAGLAPGNLASELHAHTVSKPKLAALQGLAKMKRLADLGVPQAVLPPHERPDLHMLRRLGFKGAPASIVAEAGRTSIQLLAAAYSAASMWAANAATVCPSPDSSDGKVHFTPANLVSTLHRSIEPAQTASILRRLFSNDAHFIHHDPLPAAMLIRDEGAANHMRLAPSPGEPGVHVFVYGTDPFSNVSQTTQLPARQTLQASQAVARLHGLGVDQTIFVRQNPQAIDLGVFHNDVVAVNHNLLLFSHERAYIEGARVFDEIRRRVEHRTGRTTQHLCVTEDQVPLEEAVTTYLFNSQIVTLPDQSTLMICPEECRQSDRVREFLGSLTPAAGPIQKIEFIDVRESMKNGGGPACLRLRIQLTSAQLGAMHQGVLLTDSLYTRLVHWVQKHYRDRLQPDDLLDPKLIDEGYGALDELTKILDLPRLYEFQR